MERFSSFVRMKDERQPLLCTMSKGIFFALAACFIWGLIFVVPGFMGSFSSFEVALGRYFFYGIISLLLFSRMLGKREASYSGKIWFKAFLFSLFSTFSYYVCLVLSIRYASADISALLLGLSPVTIAVYANYKKKECNFKELIVPSIMICFGLLAINLPKIYAAESPSNYFLGLLFAVGSLTLWSWYMVANAHFLKANQNICPGNWSTLVGVATFFWVLFFGGILFLVFPEQCSFTQYSSFNPEIQRFFVGAAVLGVACSWLGAFLWNRASVYLPVSLAGQLTLFETVFGLAFVYALESRLPTLSDFLGMTLFLIAVIMGIRLFSKDRALEEIIF